MLDDDAYVLMRRVRALRPDEGGQLRSRPQTAYARLEDRARALEAGLHTHIAKPGDPQELTARIACPVPEQRD
jgi:CheY-like chemotaxis protein